MTLDYLKLSVLDVGIIRSNQSAINPVAAFYMADDPSRASNRERTLTLLAAQLHSK
jgi:hypothetical protein